jgi:hypothetical protein
MRGQPHVVAEPLAVPLAVPDPEAVDELLLLLEIWGPMENDGDVAKMSVMLLWGTAQPRSGPMWHGILTRCSRRGACNRPGPGPGRHSE